MKNSLVVWTLVTAMSALGSVTMAQYQNRGVIYPNQTGQRIYGQPTYNGQGAMINRQPGYVQPGTIVQQPGIVGRPGTVIQPGVVVQQQVNRVPAVNASSASNLRLPWYAKLTDERNHDFGTVAFASTQEHTFEFVNNTGSDLFLTYVKASCGCTKPTILTPQVKPGEKAKVKAVFDTKNFYGERGATLTVSLNKAGTYQEYGELQLAVKGKIRRDVVVNPGEFDFGEFTLSESSQKTARVLYAGRPDWKILEVKSTNPKISAETREIERTPTTGRTSYEMVVKISDQMKGQFSESLTIITNDPKTTGMAVHVEGNVKPMIDVAPITLGVINEGQTINKKLIVRSPKAISIEKIETGDDRIKFTPSEGTKTLHILSYSLDTSKPGPIDQSIVIHTKDDILRTTAVSFSAQVVPSTNTSSPNNGN